MTEKKWRNTASLVRSIVPDVPVVIPEVILDEPESVEK